MLCGRRVPQSPALLERITWPIRSSCVPQEYRRAAHALRGMSGARAVFLRGYSRYLAGERRREEERVEAAGPLGKADAINAVGVMNPLVLDIHPCHQRQVWAFTLMKRHESARRGFC